MIIDLLHELFRLLIDMDKKISERKLYYYVAVGVYYYVLNNPYNIL